MEPTLTIRDLRFEPYIPAEKIHAAITALAERINRDYGTAHRPLLLVTLSGAVVFAGELFRQLDGPFEIAFVKLSSYGAGTTTSGHVAVDVPPTADVRDRDVIVAEDVVDTGTTIYRLHTLLTQQGARSIRVATLLLKPAIYYHQPTRPNPLPIDYVALEAEPKFIVGYGMDYDEQGRNLGALYTLCEDK
ncbi:phosphoribosyltransferase [Millionella massiliensis]|uniref:phosphoribosyltransferase n=1 Tax=Millionella massiliensis TaxID=1871023 RepID=UPI0008DABE50|nr:phosphoribosyltransferase family protein [Millionella massiliensis]